MAPKSNKIKRQEKLKKEQRKLCRKSSKSRNSPLAAKEERRKTLQKAIDHLNNSKANYDFKEVLKCIKENKPIDIHSPFYRQIDSLRGIKPAEKEALCRLLIHCYNEGIQINDKFLSAVKGLVCFHEFWIRELEEWKAPSYNCFRNFSSLARYLLAKYYVPIFMDMAFYSGNSLYQDWFIHIGCGQNIRTAPKLPIKLTKKAAHYFLESPSDFDISSAIRWGQIKAMGGDERLVRAVLRTRIGTVFTENEFWESVFQWFMQNPMLDTAQYAPIIDFIYNQKYVSSVPNPNLDGPVLIPPQPHFSMRKRTVEATIKQMEEWHKRTGRKKKGGDSFWQGSGLPEFTYSEGETNKKHYAIQELLSTKELQEEGAAMAHCVGSYSASCANGTCSIWSLKQVASGSVTRMLTIEVDNQSRTIRQARGKYNEKPSFKAKDIMNRWAVSTNLTVSRWLI